VPGHFGMTRLFISTCGSVLFVVFAAWLSTFAILSGLPDNDTWDPSVSALVDLVAWSTRPRATFAVFLVNAGFAWHDMRSTAIDRERFLDQCNSKVHIVMRAYKAEQMSYLYQRDLVQATLDTVPVKITPMNVFLKTCITSFLTEAHVNLTGVTVWFYWFWSTEYNSDGTEACRIPLVGAMKQSDTSSGWPSCPHSTNRTLQVARRD
jgi:hypothetical protein